MVESAAGEAPEDNPPHEAPPVRRGRPLASFRTQRGEVLHGLTRLADGRWRIARALVGRDVTFTEPDEDAAIIRFKELLREYGKPEASQEQLARTYFRVRQDENAPVDWLAPAKQSMRSPIPDNPLDAILASKIIQSVIMLMKSNPEFLSLHTKIPVDVIKAAAKNFD